MSNIPDGDHKRVTLTVVSKIQREAKQRARGGESYQAALEELARGIGFGGGWPELLKAVNIDVPVKDVAPVGINHNQVSGGRFGMLPIWERSEDELNTWFERPFLHKRAHDYPAILCLDGRIWNQPTLVSDWVYPSERRDGIELGKKNFSFFLANSTWTLQPHHESDGRWKVMLNWQHPGNYGYQYQECLYIAKNREAAVQRERLLCDIRQQRIRNFDQMFRLSSLKSL